MYGSRKSLMKTIHQKVFECLPNLHYASLGNSYEQRKGLSNPFPFCYRIECFSLWFPRSFGKNDNYIAQNFPTIKKHLGTTSENENAFSCSFELDLEFQCIKIYGSYNGDRRQFWEHSFHISLLNFSHNMIVGYLTVTFGAKNIWGFMACMDPLADFLNKFLEKVGFLDIHSSKIMPTWRNMTSWTSIIVKILDYFIIYESILETNLRIRQCLW